MRGGPGSWSLLSKGGHCITLGPCRLNFSVDRFHRWVSKLPSLLQPNGTLHSPPLDVWLVWHAYMLNPT